MFPKFLESNPPHGKKTIEDSTAERDEKLFAILKAGVVAGKITEADIDAFKKLLLRFDNCDDDARDEYYTAMTAILEKAK